MTPLCRRRCVDDSQVVDYEFRHDDGRADELPLGQGKDTFRHSEFRARLKF